MKIKRICIMIAVLLLLTACSQNGTEENPDSETFSTEVTEEEIAHLRELYPQYFDQSEFKGLEVYVWEMAEGRYSCGLMEGTNRNKSMTEIMNLQGISVDTMRKILAAYECDESVIIAQYYQHPLSSWIPPDPDSEQEKISAFFKNLPKVVRDVGGLQNGENVVK